MVKILTVLQPLFSHPDDELIYVSFLEIFLVFLLVENVRRCHLSYIVVIDVTEHILRWIH